MHVPSKLLDISDYPEKAALQLLEYLGLNPNDPEYVDTPRRVRNWFMEFVEDPDLELHIAQTLARDFDSPHKELVLETDLSFVSLCPHHLLPYSGTANIGYIPNGRVVGISKLARVLELVTHCATKQEDATAMIANSLMTCLQPQGCMVVLSAFHTCMGLRGVKQPNHRTVTSAIRGVFSDDANGCRTEFLRLTT